MLKVPKNFMARKNCNSHLKNLNRMNEIFSCLACYDQKLKFVFQKSKQRETKTL